MKTNVLFIFFKLTLSPINLQLNVTPGNYINKTARKNENVPCPRHKYKIHLRIHTTHSVQLTCNSIKLHVIILIKRLEKIRTCPALGINIRYNLWVHTTH